MMSIPHHAVKASVSSAPNRLGDSYDLALTPFDPPKDSDELFMLEGGLPAREDPQGTSTRRVIDFSFRKSTRDSLPPSTNYPSVDFPSRCFQMAILLRTTSPAMELRQSPSYSDLPGFLRRLQEQPPVPSRVQFIVRMRRSQTPHCHLTN